MTHPSPTALEEISGALDALRTNQRQLDQDGVFVGVSRQALDEVLTHIAALEAELAKARKKLAAFDKMGWICDPQYPDSCTAKSRLEDAVARAEKAEAQLATRLPTEAQISYLLEVLAKEGVTNGGGDFMRRKISKAILALLSGAATPAPTAALTEEDFREVMKALEDLSFECFSPIAPCNPPSVATYNRTFEVLNKHRAARGWKVVPKSTPQGAEE